MQVPSRPPPGLAGTSRPAVKEEQRQEQQPLQQQPWEMLRPARRAPTLARQPQQVEQAFVGLTVSEPRPSEATCQYSQSQLNHHIPESDSVTTSPTSTYASDLSPTSQGEQAAPVDQYAGQYFTYDNAYLSVPEQGVAGFQEQCQQQQYTFQPYLSTNELQEFNYSYDQAASLQTYQSEGYSNSLGDSGVYPAQADQPVVSVAAAFSAQESFDPFFGKQEESDKAGQAGPRPPSEPYPQSKDASDDDSDSSVGDDDREEEAAYDESGLAHIIPETFASESALREYLYTPLDSKQMVKCVAMYDNSDKMWTFINGSTGVRLMTAHVRTDGFKRLTSAKQWSISLSSRALQQGTRPRSGSLDVKCKDLDSHKVAKLKSDVSCSAFELYDAGLNPGKAQGAMDCRRELAGLRFSIAPDGFRLACKCAIPEIGQIRRPRSKKEELFERLAQYDNTVLPLVNHIPGRPLALPRLPDFKGMARQSSKKNMALHNPLDKSGEALFVMGKMGQNMFNVYFREPISPVVAFAMALASVAAS